MGINTFPTPQDFNSSDRQIINDIKSYVDTEVAAIKAKTDNMKTFKTQVFTASGTWARPTGVDVVEIFLVGGGGGGGGAADNGSGGAFGGGGGGGEIVEVFVPVSGNITVTIGGGGAGGSGNAAGSRGAASLFGSVRSTGGMGGGGSAGGGGSSIPAPTTPSEIRIFAGGGEPRGAHLLTQREGEEVRKNLEVTQVVQGVIKLSE